MRTTRKTQEQSQQRNAVIYARYSSHAQNETSIEAQLHECYAFCEREGYTVVGEYIDRAISGKTDDRPEFQKMIVDSAKGQFQFVIVYKLDRFARNRYDSAIYKAKLKKNGVKVISAMENISDTPEGIILESMLEGMAEYYSANLSQNVKRGHLRTIENSTYAGGAVAFGYKCIDKKLVIDEKTAPIVKHVFEQYAAGVPKKKIIAEFNEKGYRNANGKPFGYSAFSTILRNPKYKGLHLHNGREVKGGCPAIVDEKTWDAVQEKLDKARKRGATANAKVEYLLQGKVYCGYCGAPMVAENGRSRNGEKHYYYACANRKKHHTCEKKNEKKGFIEWYVCEQTVEYVLTPQRIDYIAARVVAAYDDEFSNTKVTALERRLEKINRDLTNAVDASLEVPAKARPVYYEKIELLETQRMDLEIDLSKLKIANGIRYTEEEIKAWLKVFCRGDLLDDEFQRRIIDTFINSIYLYDDKVVIYYNVKEGKQVSYIEMLEETGDITFDSDDPTGENCSRIDANVPPNRKYTLCAYGFFVAMDSNHPSSPIK